MERDRLVLFAELSQLVKSRDYYIGLGYGRSGFYHHGINRQGHTHNGQILGAGVGTGSDSQTIGLDWFLPRGLVGLKVTRTSRNKDYIYGQLDTDSESKDIKRLNVEMEYGLSGAYWLNKSFLIQLSLSYARNINWNYIKYKDVNNIRVYTGLTYRP